MRPPGISTVIRFPDAEFAYGTQRFAAIGLPLETCMGDARYMGETGDKGTMKTTSRIMMASAAAMVAASGISAPVAAATTHHRHHYYSSTHYHYKYCRHSSATTGKVVGGVTGALVGHSLLGHGLLGTAAGAAGGVVAGGAIDRASTAHRRCYYR